MIRTVDLLHIYQLAEKMIHYLGGLAEVLLEQRKGVEYIKSRAPFNIPLTDSNAYLLFLQRVSLVMR